MSTRKRARYGVYMDSEEAHHKVQKHGGVLHEHLRYLAWTRAYYTSPSLGHDCQNSADIHREILHIHRVVA